MPDATIATFKDQLRGALKRCNHVPPWLFCNEFSRCFGQILDAEVRDKTDPSSPELFQRIKESQNPIEALQLIDAFCAEGSHA